MACAGDEAPADESAAVSPDAVADDTETEDTETDAEASGDTSTDDPAEESSSGTRDGCELTSASVVEELSGGTVASQELDDFGVCTFVLEGAEVSSVFVSHYGTSAEWDAVVAGYEENRGPVTAVDGIGDEAFHPADTGENELVVLAGDTGFAVFTFEDAPGLVRQLAERIASEAG